MYTRQVTCGQCGGSGTIPVYNMYSTCGTSDVARICPCCHGTGYIREIEYQGGTDDTQYVTANDDQVRASLHNSITKYARIWRLFV